MDRILIADLQWVHIDCKVVNKSRQQKQQNLSKLGKQIHRIKREKTSSSSYVRNIIYRYNFFCRLQTSLETLWKLGHLIILGSFGSTRFWKCGIKMSAKWIHLLETSSVTSSWDGPSSLSLSAVHRYIPAFFTATSWMRSVLPCRDVCSGNSPSTLDHLTWGSGLPIQPHSSMAVWPRCTESPLVYTIMGCMLLWKISVKS